jgi:protocatechuate 3,4-dioxygenase beta subunit
MDNDDQLVGRVLSRREILTLAGTATALGVAGGAHAVLLGQEEPQTKGIVVAPEMTEGPFFVDEKLNRSDIRSNPGDGALRPGLLLELTLRLSEVSARGAKPLVGAMVDIWHCDAKGFYSDEASNGTSGQKFLRGYQDSDAKGVVKFVTIYPGWYRGRAVHIHLKVRKDKHEFTTQLFFDDKLSDKVFCREPYSVSDKRTVMNDQDGIFTQGGKKMVLPAVEAKKGFTSMFDIGFAM